jgi:hypothetical protein
MTGDELEDLCELSQELAALRAACAVLTAFAGTMDAELRNAISVINRKQFEYQERYLALKSRC